MTDEERADLVAYLDGELTGEAARAMEAKLSLDPRVRAEAESLQRAWEMLDFLPRPEPTSSFTERTRSKIAPVIRPKPKTQPMPTVSTGWGRRLWLGMGWAAMLLLAAWGGYRGYHYAVPREPGEPELIRDLRLIENKRFYETVDDFDFLKQLDDPDLFGEDTGG
jgi:hypothetical protein